MLKRRKIISCILVLLMLMLFADGTAFGDTGNVTRLSGNDRYETAIAISRQGWPGSSEYAILARGDDFPDALCAAPLAHKYNAPILLTEPDRLNPAVLEELKRLNVADVIIIGGTGAVSSDVENMLRYSEISVERIAGSDRYETSVQIASRLEPVNNVALATGDSFPDALSVSAVAAETGMPILLTGKTSLPYSVWQYIESNPVKNTYVIGGRGVIGDAVLDMVPGAVRLGGNTRFETNVAVMKEFEKKFDFSHLFMAVADGPSGDEFADALSGSVLAAKSNSPVVLVYQLLPPVLDYYLRPKVSSGTRVTVFGGEAVVPNSIPNSLLDATGSSSPVNINISDMHGSVRAGESMSMTVTTDPLNAVIGASSGNTKVASVTVSGKTITVKGVSQGSAVIYVSAHVPGRPDGDMSFMVTSPVYNVMKDSYYDSIQKAIDTSNSGDKISISPGVYREHLNIDRNNLKLIGAGRDSTIIDAAQNGMNTKAGVKILGYSGIEIKNLTVMNAGLNVTGEADSEPYGIFVSNGDLNTFENLGLRCNGSYEMYFLNGCDNNTVKNCSIDGSNPSVEGYRSLDGIFSCGGDSNGGGYSYINSGNTFEDNVVSNVVYGISLTASNSTTISGNTINAADSPYWKGSVSAGVIISNSSLNVVSGNQIMMPQYGIRMSTLAIISPYTYAGTPNYNILENNRIRATLHGIRVVGTGNTIQGNDVCGSMDGDAIWLTESAKNTRVQDNTITASAMGIIVDNISNDIHLNRITRNAVGIKNTLGSLLDASRNWWGSVSDPGDGGANNIIYSPWAVNEECTSFSDEK